MARDGGRLGVRRADPDARMSIVEHLSELRSRLAISVIVLIVAFAALYAFNGRLLDMLLDPLSPEYRSLLALSPTEPFLVTLKVVLGAAILVTLPVLLYQLYAYVVPAIGAQTRRKMLAVVGGVSLLFIGGVVFVYFLVLPVALQWLLGFAGDDFTIALRADEYFSFALTLMFAGGLVFEVPVAMLVLARMGLVSAQQFRSGWRIAIVVIAIVAAILPGGDPVSMLMLMVPQIILYGVGIWLASVFGRPAPWAAAEGTAGPSETPA
jgi:sec-independent protein translocase protein TatC